MSSTRTQEMHNLLKRSAQRLISRYRLDVLRRGGGLFFAADGAHVVFYDAVGECSFLMDQFIHCGTVERIVCNDGIGQIFQFHCNGGRGLPLTAVVAPERQRISGKSNAGAYLCESKLILRFCKPLITKHSQKTQERESR